MSLRVELGNVGLELLAGLVAAAPNLDGTADALARRHLGDTRGAVALAQLAHGVARLLVGIGLGVIAGRLVDGE